MDRTVLIGLVLATVLFVRDATGSDFLPEKGERVSFGRGIKGFKKGDMLISDAQNDWLFGSDEEYHDSNRTKRAGTEVKPYIRFWTNGIIPYVINTPDFLPLEMAEIREAMDVYEELTCLKFVQKTQEQQWIYIHHTADGCYSLLGMASIHSPGPQPISLQEPGCRDFGTYLHELGHAVGLVHEHQLPTRNNFVRYYATNVDPNNVDQLDMYDPRVVNTFNTPYDLGSIMHYDVTAFSIDDTSSTLGVDNPFLARHIGRRYSNILSFGDTRTVNQLYQCSAQCGATAQKNCPDPGYLNKKCDCITPRLYHLRTCKNADGLLAFCNQLTSTGQCDVRNIEHHKQCAKTCGFCPRFLPGDSAIGPQQTALGGQCLDRYHEPAMCQKWKNLCTDSPWMIRNCRLTCGACNSIIGVCPNLESDRICDSYKKARLCRDPALGPFLRAKCSDSCNTCLNTKTEDKACRNQLPDQQCQQAARNDGCERNPLQMFTNCASTCNRCYFNAGSCQNRSNDKDCITSALKNFCVAGQYKDETRRQCPKTCDAC